ncbi:hypothetical protein HGA02_18890, partial [Cellulomonas septica]|nr:hypothetical protein [Cellulomonas septica]
RRAPRDAPQAPRLQGDRQHRQPSAVRHHAVPRAHAARAGGRLVARDDFRAVVRTDHPLVDAGPIPLAELVDDGLLVSGGGCEAQVRRLHRTAGLPFSPGQRVRELATMLRMVDEGIGVSVMPSLGGGLLPDGVVMAPLAPTLTRDLVLTGPTTRPWHPLVRALVAAADEHPLDATSEAVPALAGR